jgi:hypothetical protein
MEFVKPLQTHPWGARSFRFREPDGNLVDFYSNVKIVVMFAVEESAVFPSMDG